MAHDFQRKSFRPEVAQHEARKMINQIMENKREGEYLHFINQISLATGASTRFIEKYLHQFFIEPGIVDVDNAGLMHFRKPLNDPILDRELRKIHPIENTEWDQKSADQAKKVVSDVLDELRSAKPEKYVDRDIEAEKKLYPKD
jgi:hypothetical protein